MAQCRAEFIVEPFVEGNPGPHVDAAVAAAQQGGLAADVGPFGTSVEGEAAVVLATLNDVIAKSLDAGASRISVQMTVVAE